MSSAWAFDSEFEPLSNSSKLRLYDEDDREDEIVRYFNEHPETVAYDRSVGTTKSVMKRWIDAAPPENVLSGVETFDRAFRALNGDGLDDALADEILVEIGARISEAELGVLRDMRVLITLRNGPVERSRQEQVDNPELHPIVKNDARRYGKFLKEYRKRVGMRAMSRKPEDVEPRIAALKEFLRAEDVPFDASEEQRTELARQLDSYVEQRRKSSQDSQSLSQVGGDDADEEIDLDDTDGEDDEDEEDEDEGEEGEEEISQMPTEDEESASFESDDDDDDDEQMSEARFDPEELAVRLAQDARLLLH